MCTVFSTCLKFLGAIYTDWFQHKWCNLHIRLSCNLNKIEKNSKTCGFWSHYFNPKDSEEIVNIALYVACIPIFFNLLPLWKMNLWHGQWILGCFTLRRKLRWLLWKFNSRISKVSPKTMYQIILGNRKQNCSRLVVLREVIIFEGMLWI